MANYQVSYNQTTRVALIQADGAAAPAGSVDIGSYTHDDEEPALRDLEFGVNHVHFQHVRDLLYKRSAANANQTAKFPNNITDMHNVTILFDVTSIEVGANFSLPVGQTKKLYVAFTPKEASDQALTFSTSDATKATVSTDGVVTGVAEGSATITATSANGKTDTLTVTVTD